MIFLKKDQASKVRVIEITLVQAGESYTIKRFTGLLNGKMTHQPDIIISSGKAKRNVKEQAYLQYNSECKKYLDKGYITLDSLGINNLSELESDMISDTATDTNGAVKPMLCISYDKLPKSFFDKELWISRKHDGTRCLLRWDGNKVITSSRGGQDYNIAAKYICEDEFIVNLFKTNPTLILDGEIYKHGWNLAKISGLCRLETNVDDHKQLMFHCYDIVDETKTFSERLITLKGINPPPESKLVIVEHLKCQGFDNIMKLHNQFVQEGYEGAVARVPDAKYKCGARSKNYMIKFKIFDSSEHLIKDLVDGLRDEDMCFLMQTKEGYEFKAKPVGDRELKKWYREHIDEIKGKLGTVKHFGWTTTDKPVPNLPVFQAIRDVKDI